MNTSPEVHSTAAQSFPPPINASADPEDDPLRDLLKRCPPATYAAARRFRTTGDVRQVPVIVLGIIERFTESALRFKLKEPHDSLVLSEDLGLDSLTLMELVLVVEDVLAITIKNEELRTLRTLGDVRQFIEGKLRAGSPAESTLSGQ